ncbi:hypothetical protein JQX09_23075 [Sulfitobacter pseudonitzschiae]|uniref:Uncharacterized protein n=1 Tax=Pseudosulfitobacter pseudonitzschiae TaxID=1402135 RepID=A0A9Q2NUZ5_9RHOB|nr:hypothetical protein [Pseudosulfitobacter pseudonitzschiae]MBM2294834.1 hypothetical protein [Pseudosulfitobacter pseudonitzschiae]MBM2299771.1 hypothetical protein [Pseudosulfitobacter pseudonitzschiae]MBM2304671.1 hypothetical protein [Pseudosulfitobacter pseudonitzschiae]MBM2314444.1 hypothetical protein [Pseudosulfitobacter pseudonitzschiae]MBM2319340.1 hypothetical protein [Pseudosulfitobacter pseudonitzschiae]
MVSHSRGLVRQMYDAGAMLEDGKLTFCDNLDEAIEVHQANMAKPHRN